MSPDPSENLPPAELRVGHRVELKKPHPCGSLVWRVARLGAEVDLRCEGCGRRVLLPRATVTQRLRRIVSPEEPSAE